MSFDTVLSFDTVMLELVAGTTACVRSRPSPFKVAHVRCQCDDDDDTKSQMTMMKMMTTFSTHDNYYRSRIYDIKHTKRNELVIICSQRQGSQLALTQ